MDKVKVRIVDVEIRNFKNIEYGYVNLINNKYSSSVLGLYGQNGSGKTALIDCISLLKNVLCGLPVEKKYVEYISVDKNNSEFAYKFSIESDDMVNEVLYSFKLGREERLNQSSSGFGVTSKVPIIYDEKFSTSLNSVDIVKKMQEIINTSSNFQTFGPYTKYKMIIPEKKDNNDIIIIKRLTSMQSRSFIFSSELLKLIRKQDNEYRKLVDAIVEFGLYHLFVIDTTNSALISLNAFPLAFSLEEGDRKLLGNITISSEPSIIPKEIYNILQTSICSMNIVLKQLVPDLIIEVKNMGPSLLKDGREGYYIELVSNRNGKCIPIKYESEGIKKIISILQLLIVVYNNPSTTVAIDELDSGVFEYLLGEILKIISESGKGQLIFTSHNLRPLETIDKCFIAFTTTNPTNRFVRMKNVNRNNNLRDLYYRDIVLGGQSETLYDETNCHEIAFVFKEAIHYGS